MLVTPYGIVIFVNPLQFLNAEEPIVVTLSGIIILVRALQPPNAELPMTVTLPSSGMTLIAHPQISVLDLISIRQFPTDR